MSPAIKQIIKLNHSTFRPYITVTSGHRLLAFKWYLPYPTKGVKQLRQGCNPNSHFLKQLDASENSLKDAKLFSYWTPLDLSIITSSNCYWKIAENRKIFSLSHISIIFNRRVINEIILKLEDGYNTKGTEPNE